MEAIIKTFISRELISKPELPPLKDDTPLLESGLLDSLALLRLLVFLEEELHVSVDDFEVLPENFETIASICAYVRSQQNS